MATIYPFDPSGTNPECRILNEQHIISAVNFRDFNYVIPDYAPFFSDNLVITMQDLVGNVRPLVDGVDYYLSHHFIGASKACAKPIYGSICFLNSQTAGVLRISYQTLGGIWNISESEIASILADNIHNPRITSWESITDLPIAFPVIDHEWNLIDMVGASEIVDRLSDIHDALVASTGGGLSSHISNVSNPHNVTKSQVGLGNVQNLPLATVGQAQAGAINTAYMTPVLVKAAIDASTNVSIASHTSRTDNPHSVTKGQVGLNNVDNFATANLQTAIDGVSNAHFMTPAVTKALINSVQADFSSHISNLANPHSTTKSQVGLNNVENYAIATISEAQSGSINTAYMTPNRVSQAISTLALIPLSNHANNTSNPHSVTKGQVGLNNVENYPIASQLEAEAVTSNSLYMTPLRTAQAALAISNQIVSGHANNTSNPHSVTAAQVNAYTRTETDNLLIAKLGTTAKAADTILFDGRSFTTARNEILSGTAFNTDRIAGVLASTFIADYNDLDSAFDLLLARVTNIEDRLTAASIP